ncbi:class I SAM-dependent methyltransferase [Ectothiorhodospiraceae bacterium 2226]|nr:class I SAM-dependent methyltransferase [Ectothiorhodospiraceae bacterium 2226]
MQQRREADPRLALVERFFAGTGPSYDFMVNAATFGIDRLWKRRIVDAIPPHALSIVDLACGTGISTLAIAKRFPRSRIVGVELREEYLQHARRKVQNEGLEHVELVLSRAEDFLPAERFDCISSSYLAKYAELPTLVANAHSLLNEDGVFIAHDFTYPAKPALVRIWRAYFAVMQRVSPVLFPSWNEIYYGLPELIERTKWLQELPPLLEEHGFRNIEVTHLTAYGSALVRAERA